MAVMKGYTMEVHRKVFDEEGHFLTIRPSADFPEGSVMLYAETSEEEYFGVIRLDLPAGFMRKIGEALIACANELESKP
jgi:hypothetical protein